MSWIESSLTRLEARLKAMIEGDATRDGISRRFYSQLLSGLIAAMQADVKMSLDNPHEQDYTSPDQYTLVLPAEEAQLLLTHPAALDRLARKLENSAMQLKIPFTSPPMLRVVADPSVQELKIFCSHSQAGVGDSLTRELDGQALGSVMENAGSMPEAFLIVNGLSTFRLTQAVINIGSDPSNQLVLQNPRVSHLHAQLRLTTGRFAIFDLDSREGTFVNGIAVSNHLLNPGDVILLAGVPLVYGEETATGLGYTQKLPAEPPPPEVL